MSAEAALPPPVGADAPPPPAGPGAPKTVRSWSTAQLKRTLRLANLCNGVTLITLGIIVFLVAGATASFTNITIRSASRVPRGARTRAARRSLVERRLCNLLRAAARPRRGERARERADGAPACSQSAPVAACRARSRLWRLALSAPPRSA